VYCRSCSSFCSYKSTLLLAWLQVQWKS